MRRPARPAQLACVPPVVHSELVAELRKWLQAAERGEVIGVVLLGNLPGRETLTAWMGDMPLSKALFAFECAKFEQMRNVQETDY